jgi:iron complex outermembrane receptor protein
MKFHKSLLAVTVASILGSATSAAEEESSEKKAKNDYEVIVVTQKRVQTLKEVPVSVSAYGEGFLEDFNVDNATDLAKFTPGLNGGSENDSYIDSIGIRGIVTSDYGIGGDPSIGLYFDGVYQGRSGGAVSSFFDISRVEVTKGPQGTLFGRNAASGAISIYSNEAVDGTEGSIEFGIGSDNLQEITGMFNTNLSDDAFIRFSGTHVTEDSFVDNFEGGSLRDREMSAARLNFTYEGWDDSKLRLIVNYEDRDMDGGVYRSIWTEGDERKVASDLGAEGKDVAEVFATTLNFEHDFGDYIFTSQTAMKNYTWDYLEDYDGTAQPLGIYSQKDDTEYLSQEFRINSDTDSDIYWFVGINIYEEKIDSSFYNGYDDDAFCAQLPNLEEWDQPLGSHTSAPEDYYADCHELFVDGWYGLDPVEDADEIAGLVEDGEIPGAGDGVVGVREQVHARGTNSGYGIYGDLTWTVNDKTDITVGGRFSYDEKEFGLNLPEPDGWLGHYWLVGGHTDGQWIDDKKDWSEFTPRLAVNHKLTNDINVYANYSRGYKSGGFNTFAFNINFQDWTGYDADEEWFDYEPDGVVDETDIEFWGSELYGGALPEGTTLASYDPEIVDSYEVGMKGEFLDDKLKVNLGAYYYDYQDFQGIFAVAGGSVIKNIGQASGQGVEFDVTYLPTENLRLYLASAFQSSEVDEGEDLNGDDLKGQKLSAPDMTASFVGSYFWYLESDIDLQLQVSYTWQSEQFGDEFLGGTDLLEQESYGLTGMQFSATGMSWQVSAYVENLTDETYFEGAVEDTGISRFGIGRGRNAGVKVKYSF